MRLIRLIYTPLALASRSLSLSSS